MTSLHFGRVQEEVITRKDFSLLKAKKKIGSQLMVVLGYGSQGQSQALNLRDNGFHVIVGQRRPSASWNKAIKDGWIPGKTLFPLKEAAARGNILFYLLSDAGQKKFWPILKSKLKKGMTLVFAHGFSVVYSDLTSVIPPDNIDVLLVAPKGSGLTLRQNFLKRSSFNASCAVFQNTNKNALEKCFAIAMGIGCTHVFTTTFEKEVYCNLTSERGVLLGALTGIMEAQYTVLRQHHHKPSEAFQETVETLTESLLPIMSDKGIEWMYAHCSTTAQRGALDWKKHFREAVTPVFEKLYKSVAEGKEAQIILKKNSRSDYRKELNAELKTMIKSEMWETGKVMRKLRSKSS